MVTNATAEDTERQEPYTAPQAIIEPADELLMDTPEAAKHFEVSRRHARLKAMHYNIEHPGDEYPKVLGRAWIAPYAVWKKIMEKKFPNMGRPKNSS